jgi:hypothetical protein
VSKKDGKIVKHKEFIGKLKSSMQKVLKEHQKYEE